MSFATVDLSESFDPRLHILLQLFKFLLLIETIKHTECIRDPCKYFLSMLNRIQLSFQ